MIKYIKNNYFFLNQKIKFRGIVPLWHLKAFLYDLSADQNVALWPTTVSDKYITS